MTILKTAWGGDRVHLTINLDKPRHGRLLQLADDYSKAIGRPVSLSLLFVRAVDLLAERMDELHDPASILAERLAIAGPARQPLPTNDGD